MDTAWKMKQNLSFSNYGNKDLLTKTEYMLIIRITVSKLTDSHYNIGHTWNSDKKKQILQNEQKIETILQNSRLQKLLKVLQLTINLFNSKNLRGKPPHHTTDQAKWWEMKNEKIFDETTRVVPKLVFTLARRTCKAIYWNSNKAHVFCRSLSFQKAPADVCIPNRS